MTVQRGGYIFVRVVTLDLFEVSIQNLLLGGAITGVVLGIALQQILGNVFAALPCCSRILSTSGDRIMLRSGAYGGEVHGCRDVGESDLCDPPIPRTASCTYPNRGCARLRDQHRLPAV